eukprot:3581196-Amphidinium_carterae.1
MDQARLQGELRTWQIEGNEPVAADYCQAALMLPSQPDPGMDLLKDEIKALKKQLDIQQVKKIKLSQVLDQSIDDEVEIDRAHIVQACVFKRFASVMGGPPSHDEESSMNQVEGVKHMLHLGFPPICGFQCLHPICQPYC